MLKHGQLAMMGLQGSVGRMGMLQHTHVCQRDNGDSSATHIKIVSDLVSFNTQVKIKT